MYMKYALNSAYITVVFAPGRHKAHFSVNYRNWWNLMEFNENGAILVKSTKIVGFNGFYEIPDFGSQKHLANLWKTYGLIDVLASGPKRLGLH